MFVSPGVPEAIRERLLPLADIVLPIASSSPSSRGGRSDRSRTCAPPRPDLRARGPRLVVVTGLTLPERPGELAVLADAAEEAWLVTTPQLPLSIGGGTGDAFSALFLGHYLNAGELRAGLERAVAAMFALVERVHRRRRGARAGRGAGRAGRSRPPVPSVRLR